jgi:hypothetical protein
MKQRRAQATVRIRDGSRARGPNSRWLPHIVAVLGTACGVIFAPPVDSDHPAAKLSSFFATAAQVSVTLLVAVALYQGSLGDVVAHRARRWVGPLTFVYLGVAVVAGVAGSTTSVGSGAYCWLFGFSVGAGAAGLLTVLLMGAANIGAQLAMAVSARGETLDQPTVGDMKSPH